ncbi:MAG: serine/threonine protein kinase [Armatimonadota bacterium]|nr:MAG: serine/threonine protein kinase [Armatimonadota bacterium]
MRKASSRVPTGIAGLDEVLGGGLIPQRAYLLRGAPGTGKTLVGLHFLVSGARREKPLFIALDEPEYKVRQNAASVGLDLRGVHFLDLTPSSDFFAQIQTYDLFTPAEVERAPVTQMLVERVRELKPKRVFVDSMTHFRYFAPNEFEYRKQVLSFLRFLTEQGATVIFTSEGSALAPDDDLQSLSDGVIHLEMNGDNRRLRVTKMRGSSFRTGVHALRINGQGVQVYPQILPEPGRFTAVQERVSSGVRDLDALLHGGLERGTIVLLTGASGVGKTTLGMQWMKEAAVRGERSVVYSFEEEVPIILARCASVGIPAASMVEQGKLSLVKVEPLQHSATEFAYMVREEVEERGARIVMMDSVAGYRLSLHGEDLVGQLHALCKWLQSRGVVTLLINETHTVSGPLLISEVGLSYLADTVLFLRYAEKYTPQGAVLTRVIGVLKKRMSDFDHTLREFRITPEGIQVGQPIPNLRNIVADTPVWEEGI